MRCLGLDLGSKTLGIAISDMTNTIAMIYTTLRFDEDDYDSLIPQLKDIILKNDINVEKQNYENLEKRERKKWMVLRLRLFYKII